MHFLQLTSFSLSPVRQTAPAEVEAVYSDGRIHSYFRLKLRQPQPRSGKASNGA